MVEAPVDSRKMRILEKKYKLAKKYLENYKDVNQRLREQIDQERAKKDSQRARPRLEQTSQLRLENSRLQEDLRRFRHENERLSRKMRSSRSGPKPGTSQKQLEIERSKNRYLQQENHKLQDRIRDLNFKFSEAMDRANRRRVDNCLPMEPRSSLRVAGASGVIERD